MVLYVSVSVCEAFSVGNEVRTLGVLVGSIIASERGGTGFDQA